MFIHVSLNFIHRVSGRWLYIGFARSAIVGRCYFNGVAPMLATTIPSSRSGNNTPEVNANVS